MNVYWRVEATKSFADNTTVKKLKLFYCCSVIIMLVVSKTLWLPLCILPPFYIAQVRSPTQLGIHTSNILSHVWMKGLWTIYCSVTEMEV